MDTPREQVFFRLSRESCSWALMQIEFEERRRSFFSSILHTLRFWEYTIFNSCAQHALSQLARRHGMRRIVITLDLTKALLAPNVPDKDSGRLSTVAVDTWGVDDKVLPSWCLRSAIFELGRNS